MDSAHSQTPQCDGLYQDRYLFNSRVSSPAPISYVPRHDADLNAFIINAGMAHGVTDGAEFAFHVAQETNPLGTYIVDKATSFYSILKPADKLTISDSSLPSGLVAFQTKLGQGNVLRLYVREPSDRLTHPTHRDLILQACGNDLHHILFVNFQNEAHLELAVQENRVVITVRDTKITQHGRFQLPTTIIAMNKLGLFLNKALSFYRELDHCGADTEVVEDVNVEFYKLQDTPSFSEDVCELELSPSGANLHHDGAIHLAVEDGCSYGVKLTNDGPYDLYPGLFYFDSNDLTRIRELF